MSKSQQLLDAVAASQRVFKSAYGYAEWRRACEVGGCTRRGGWVGSSGAGSHAAGVLCAVPCLVFGCCIPTCSPATRRPCSLPPLPACPPACPRQQGACSGIKASARTYRELRDNLGEGLRFYMGLQEAIGSLRQQAGDHVMTRRIQRCAPPTCLPARLPAVGTSGC